MSTITICGNLGKDVELKDVGGKTVAEFSVADTSGYGQNKQSNWFKVTIWDGLAKTNFVDYLKKGQQVMVTGEFSAREYNGKTYFEIKRVYDIKLCGSSASNGQAQQQSQPKPQQPQQGYANTNKNNDLDDDLPF